MKNAILLVATLFFALISLLAKSQTDPFFTPPDGIISFWAMEENVLDEVSNNDAIAVSGVEFPPGREGDGASFNSNAYIDIAAAANLQNQEFTAEMWVRPNGPGPNNDQFGSVVFQKGLPFPTGTNTVSFGIWWSGLDNRFRTAVGPVAQQHIFSNNTFPPGQFYHVAVTYDNTTLKLYVNGELESQIVLDYTIPYNASVPWTIGSTASHVRNVGFPRTLIGIIDEVRVYDRALSQSEIQTNFQFLGSSGFINGKVYNDINSNFIFDPGIDVPIVNRRIEADPGPYSVYTNNDGDFSFRIPPGNYTIKQELPADDVWDLTDVPAGGSYNVDVLRNATSTDNDFPLVAKLPPLCDGNISITSIPFLQGPCSGNLTSPCPGNQHQYCVTVNNTGVNSFPMGPLTELEIMFDPNITYSSVLSDGCGFNPPTVGGGGTTLNFVAGSDILPGASCSVCVIVDVNALSTPWITTAGLDADCFGPGALVATDMISDDNSCSCDPNDKMVTPKGCGPNGNIGQNEDLTYQIRFENIGTGPAHNIIIRDQLDSDIDPGSIRIISSSHTVTALQLHPNEILDIVFEGIELPGVDDPANNKGYVVLKVEPYNDLPDGTEIKNTASIYFDSNKPVITNTTLNTIYKIPEPDADFKSVITSCSLNDLTVDFEYSGETPDNATFFWDFGPNATPASSTDMNPAGIMFNSSGPHNVALSINRHGCEATIAKTVGITDATCGNNKVLICHTPPGNPENAHTLCVNANSLAAHLAHGDVCGPCSDDKSLAHVDSRVQIIPNPSHGIFQLSFDESTTKASTTSISIYDMVGKLVYSETVNGKVNNHSIDLSNQTNGLYTLHVVVDDQKIIEKIVKQ